jgi:hypothetical protein
MTGHDRDQELRSLLGTLREDSPAGEPQDEFAARLHQRLAQVGAPREPNLGAALLGWLRERPWLVGATAGAISGVAAFALSAAIAGQAAHGRGPAARSPKPDDRATGPAQQVALACPEPAAPVEVAATAEVFVVPVGKVAMVQLHFAVDRDVEVAEFSVLLPDGLSFFSEGQALPERAYHWEAPLARGDNTVPVAVLGAKPGRHTLAATATIAGEVVVHEIVLDVKEPA